MDGDVYSAHTEFVQLWNERRGMLVGLIPKFARIGQLEGTEVLLDEVLSNRGALKFGNEHIAHQQAQHLHIQNSLRRSGSSEYHGNILENKPTDIAHLFPEINAWLVNFARTQQGTLQRRFISILKPHGRIHVHYDEGKYFGYCDRYHLVLKSHGTLVRVENESVTFQQGELWWFNNRLFHEFSHNSDDERIHLIFDLLPNSFIKRFFNYLQWKYISFVYALLYPRYIKSGVNRL